MVLLTMTPALVDVVKLYLEHASTIERGQQDQVSLEEPREGKPISHAQVITISKWLSSRQSDSRESNQNLPRRLDGLLKGCRVYQAPKVEPKEQVGNLATGICLQHDADKYNRLQNIEG